MLFNECPLSRQRDDEVTLTKLLYGAARCPDGNLIVGREIALCGQPGSGRQLPRLDPGCDVVSHADIDVDRSEGIGVELRNLGHEDHPRTLVNCGKSQSASYCFTLLYTAL
jgi:hypothetical protein